MTCHNCGAEMERHAFVFVCSYCKSIISINDGEETFASDYIHNSVDNSHFYTYVQKNITYLQSNSNNISITRNNGSYIIQTIKEFHPLDKHYKLCNKFGLKWKAVIDKNGAKLSLIVTGTDKIDNSLCIILDEDIHLILRPLNSGEYMILYDDFLMVCHSECIVFLLKTALCFDEFITYSHRFYNLVFDRTRYKYSIYHKLLTD